MPLKDTRQLHCCNLCKALYIVIRALWIATLFNSTKFDIFLNALIWRALVFVWVRFFAPFFQEYGSIFPHCRSPPSDFDFASKSTHKSKLEDKLMKEINLREYYPYYTTDKIVKVPDEVADLLHEYKLNEAAHFLRTYRHKAYFSLDYDANVERDALVIVLTPAEILEQEEETAQLYRAVAMLPEKQRNRITSHFLLGMSISEIAKSENSAPSSVHEGIQRGLRRLKKILEEI